MVFVALILAAAAPADAVPATRKAYASCLSTYTNDASSKKMARAEFLGGLKSKCADKETAFRNALVATNKVDGMNEADAKKDADDQVAEYVDKMTSDFDSAN